MPSRRLLIAALAFALPPAAGCNPYTRLPTLASPGNTATQRFDAIYHDPYPLDDLGPEIVGGRPRGFSQPAPAVVRGRLLRGVQTATPRATVVPQADPFAPAPVVSPSVLPPGAVAPPAPGFAPPIFP